MRHFLKQISADLRLARQQLHQYEVRDKADPIVIVGMSCRFPGGVRNPDELWNLVATGTDAVSLFPSDRGWDTERIYDPNGDRPGTTLTREGGFLYGAAEFDAGFFGISPREATGMDPQQRLLLETSWEALEYAAIDPAGLRGSRTAVYVGAAPQGYGFDAQSAGVGLEGYGITGVSTSLLSGRIAYTLGLEGAALTIDTACSSSLVALHLACQALSRGECDLALAGGVTVMAAPSGFIEFSRQGGLAPDGRCKSFSDDADGTGWSEGVGMLVVERLSDALRSGHEVLAVVRGSAVNQDGASNGLTAPNGQAQQRVILDSLASGGLTPADVDLVEGHGTGTRLGDPIEAQALIATYGRAHADTTPLYLGSLKSNIGHAQAAAGVGGIIKMVQAMRYGSMPPSLHVEKPTSEVAWEGNGVELLTQEREWSRGAGPRRAGVSSFGISGTNAHVVLEEFNSGPGERGPAAGAPSDVVPLVLSAKSGQALSGQAAALRDFLNARPGTGLAEVARSLVTTRSLFSHRAVLVGDRTQLLTELDQLAVAAPTTPAAGDAPLTAVFTGQGAQRVGMGRELSRAFPAFNWALDEICSVVDPFLGRGLREVMWSDADDAEQTLARTEYAQPALFAFELALARLWQSWGVRFGAVTGHSVGEIAAAVTAGVLTLEDAARLVVTRGRLMQQLPPGGAMLAVNASDTEVTTVLAGTPEVVVAAVNGPDSVVVSGGEEHIGRLADHWRQRGTRVARLNVSHAFHSPLMDPVLEEFRAVLNQITFRPPTLLVHPAADTSHPIDTPDYWIDHVRNAVHFAKAVDAIPRTHVLVEIGPDAALTPLTTDTHPTAPTCRKGRPETQTVLQALGHAHTHGAAVDWTAVLPEARAVRLPAYAFQHQRFWLTPARTAGHGRDASGDQAFWAAVEKEDFSTLAETLGVPAELEPAVPALARWHRDNTRRRTMDSWRYRVVWNPVEWAPASQAPGSWLVVLPHGGGDPDVLRSLTRVLADVVTVELGREADRRATAEALAMAVKGVPLLSGVICLPGRPENLLVLVQALGDIGAGARLWCLTRGAVATTEGEAPDPLSAACWGVGLVAGLEHPGRWGGLIDLPGRLDDRSTGWLAGVLAGDGEEDQLAIRVGGVLRRRLVPAPTAAEPRSTWRPGGTVLVTGGIGSIGAHVARWLTAQGPCSLVLVSRRGAETPGAGDLRKELQGRGARVRLAAADVTDRESMAALVAEVAADEGPVRAVFHAAGVGQNTAIADMGLDEFRAVSSSKTDGARVLDELFADDELDAFVLFSSVSGVWGSGRYAAYAAGNAYLDALAERRRARGLPATAVAWGVWAESGMVGPDGERHLLRRGLVPMPPEDCVAALGRALDDDETRVTVADVDWETFLVGYTAARRRPLVEELPQARDLLGERPAAAPASQGDIRRTLAGLAPQERRIALRDLVSATVADVLGHADAASVDAERPFVEMGFDSMSAVEVRNRLNVATGLALPAMLVFEHPTVVAIGEFLHTTLADGAPAGPHTAGPVVESGESFAAIYRQVAIRGRMTEVEALLTGAAGLRSRFTDPSQVEGGPGFVRLATGGDGPAVICFPPFAPVEQSLQFARLSMFFRGRRDLSMVFVPGFLPDEPIAATREALVEALARETMRCGGGRPFALLGYSSSGWLAHSVAARLEEREEPAQGLVLLDTYLPDSMSLSMRQAMTYEVNERRSRFTTMNFTTLTALGAYRRLFRGWVPEPAATPTLFVRPEDCIPGDPAAPPMTEDWRAHWPLPHRETVVPGDHCTIVAEHAEAVAAEVHTWLEEQR
ncbi:type I polyketide synthase [Streptomyces sp. NPDC051677]|uniref:type I polyketide synthase n=1 Tax=Streptomyces sp. NPDC051677 TaxID=3365669 RepID=UPI0037D7D131